MAGREVELRVVCPTHLGESLAVTGSTDLLGCWRKEGVLHMVRDPKERDLWTLNLGWMELAEPPSYRYCVLVRLPPVPPATKRSTVVRRWETHQDPRRLDAEKREDVFGEVAGVHRVQRGWLTEEVERVTW